jgi:butyryl-CoA dehydrogenase
LALDLYCARLVDELHTGDHAQKHEAQWLLEVLTPIVKSWPSEWCLEANSLAIQIHGGYGYTRDFPVEQYWRDNRLNMIHEGTHGIQAMDLLGRKVLLDKGLGLQLLGQRLLATCERASTRTQQHQAQALQTAWTQVVQSTQDARKGDDTALSLANAVPYMQAFGHTVLAWIWLDVSLSSQGNNAASQGRRQACQYFFNYELPKTGAWLNVVQSRDATCAHMPEDAF